MHVRHDQSYHQYQHYWHRFYGSTDVSDRGRNSLFFVPTIKRIRVQTIVPIEDNHQFRSTDVEFLLNEGSNQLLASNNIVPQPWSSIKLVKFSLLHAKNIRRDFGVPIWFSSTDATGAPVPFVQLVYLWASLSQRQDGDPFLSFRTAQGLTCLLYKHSQSAGQSAARHFGLTGTWFNTQSIRMSAPTIAAATNARTRVLLQMGRWASKPAALLYQHQSTAANNNMLSIVRDPTLFTKEDILLSRVLASLWLRPVWRWAWLKD